MYGPMDVKFTGTHCTGASVNLTVGLAGSENLTPLPFNPLTVQPVLIR